MRPHKRAQLVTGDSVSSIVYIIMLQGAEIPRQNAFDQAVAVSADITSTCEIYMLKYMLKQTLTKTVL